MLGTSFGVMNFKKQGGGIDGVFEEKSGRRGKQCDKSNIRMYRVQRRDYLQLEHPIETK